ncbi:hypothetical protein LSUE1_G005576, partial [Lachnellula suecica]
NRSILSFFKPTQPVMKAATPPPLEQPPPQAPPTTFKTPSKPSSSVPHTPYAASNASKSSEQREYTPSPSPPANSDHARSPASPAGGTPVIPVPPSSGISGRVVKSSDDEDSGSDESLPDIFQSANRPAPVKNASTPTAPRRHMTLVSPLPIHTKKYKFSLESMVNQVQAEKATQESFKRVKAMLAKDENENSNLFASGHDGISGKLDGDILQSVVANKEEGGMEKVTRALLRTEATNVEKRWNFFNTQEQQTTLARKPFPVSSIPATWKTELSKPAMRQQAFVSGFAEDMVHFGQTLPDEIFLWILDEACLESNDALRNSYSNVLKESGEQIQRLLTPDRVDKMLRDVGGTLTATTITEKIIPSPKINGQYSDDWANVRSVVLFFTQAAKLLQQQTKEHIICMLLRMSADHVVFKNVDLLDLIQNAIRRLSRHLQGDDWETSCQTICKHLFESIEQPSLRLQVIEAISSVQPYTHELRRRLALCFFFNDLAHATDDSHTTFSLPAFISRLSEPAFAINAQTDYQQLAALISLLDAAVDDGRCAYLDLNNRAAADRFDKDVDALVANMKDVIRDIGSPGTAFISRIEAKEMLLLVAQRIEDTLRSRPKPKESVFDGRSTKREEDYTEEQATMKKFLARTKSNNLAIAVEGQATAV